jgi:HEAT repeat protein
MHSSLASAAMPSCPYAPTRIRALEQWAAQSDGSSVDPLTYALVDEDEQVRARAQELLEEALARGQSP